LREVETLQAGLLVLVVLAAIPHLILGGSGVDRLVVHLPARHRIGAVAYANYARATDMGNGFYLYPLLGIGGPVLTFAALVVALVQRAPSTIVTLLVVASVLAILHSITTTQAAPTMMRVGKAEDREEVIAPLLDRFTFWSWFRSILQIATGVVLVWALIVH
jgi:hypothetical protein